MVNQYEVLGKAPLSDDLKKTLERINEGREFKI